jgi:hypothetical protein
MTENLGWPSWILPKIPLPQAFFGKIDYPKMIDEALALHLRSRHLMTAAIPLLPPESIDDY